MSRECRRGRTDNSAFSRCPLGQATSTPSSIPRSRPSILFHPGWGEHEADAAEAWEPAVAEKGPHIHRAARRILQRFSISVCQGAHDESGGELIITLGRHAVSWLRLRVWPAILHGRVHLRSSNWITRRLLRVAIRHWCRIASSPSPEARCSSSAVASTSTGATIGCLVYANRSAVKPEMWSERVPRWASNQALGL
jgi:hypothetical protein